MNANVDSQLESQLRVIASDVRIKVLNMTHIAGTSHVGSCLSCVEILTAAFYIQKFDSQVDIQSIILSKGHAAAALYASLSEFGILKDEDLKRFCEDGSKLYGHVNHHASDAIPVSTGSLGHGIPFGLGLAIANKMLGNNKKVLVVISDGECNEGTTWESALIANHHRISNLIVIIDRNRIQSMGFTEEILAIDPLKEKWEAFGWQTLEISGNDANEIVKAIKKQSKKPLCIIANTIKGFGVNFMENSIEWHYRSPNSTELKEALSQIDKGLVDV